MQLTHRDGYQVIDLQYGSNISSSTLEKPVLLILANHDSHLSLEAIDTAKTDRVHMMTFPPHCSHKIQPLDIAVYRSPLKRYFGDTWQLANPGKTITIYNISSLLGQAYPREFTMSNITASFQKPGIFPFNRDAFSDYEFLSAFVTDRPQPTQANASTASNTSIATLVGLNDVKGLTRVLHSL